MARFLATLGALGFSLAATAAYAHGVGSQGFADGGQHSFGLSVMQGNPAGAIKVQGLTDHDPNRDRRDTRELAEKQRVQTEVVSLKTRALLLVEKLNMLETAKGDPREIARLTEEIRHLGNKVVMLEHEEKGSS